VMSMVQDPNHFVYDEKGSFQPTDVKNAQIDLAKLAVQTPLTRRVAYNLFDFENAMNSREIQKSHALVKAAVDTAYTSNAPASLGFSTAYSEFNRPYEVSSLIPRSRFSRNPASLFSSLPYFKLRVPPSIADTIALRSNDKTTGFEFPKVVESFEHWWELFQKRCRDNGLDKLPDIKMNMMKIQVDQLRLDSVRINGESNGIPLKVNIVVPNGLEKECSERDIEELSFRTNGNSVLPSHEQSYIS
jgi:hypothetical protein